MGNELPFDREATGRIGIHIQNNNKMADNDGSTAECPQPSSSLSRNFAEIHDRGETESDVALSMSVTGQPGVSEDAERESDPAAPQLAAAHPGPGRIQDLGASNFSIVRSSAAIEPGSSGSAFDQGNPSGPHSRLIHGAGTTPIGPPSITEATLSIGSLSGEDRVAMQVEGTAFDPPLHAERQREIASRIEIPAMEPDHSIDGTPPFRNDTRFRTPDIATPPPSSKPAPTRPPPVREPGSLRVPNRRYQNVEGVPDYNSPFIGVPEVHYPVNSRDTGYGPAPPVQSVDRHGRGINPYQMAPAALTQRLNNARHLLRPAHQVLYNALWSQAPPNFVDVRLLGDIQVTAVELLTVSEYALLDV
jgi:hypothetical protein